jgi:hypothetical protein
MTRKVAASPRVVWRAFLDGLDASLTDAAVAAIKPELGLCDV